MSDVERVLVVGTSGSGKTTLARHLAQVISVPHVELDALFWNADWEQADIQTFRARAAAALDGDRWVACGNYWSKLKDLTWARADTVVWLDLPLRTCYRRIVSRTLTRSVLRQQLWGGNRESVANLWASDSLLREIGGRKKQFAQRYGTATQEYPHLIVVRLTSAADVRRWRRTAAGRA